MYVIPTEKATLSVLRARRAQLWYFTFVVWRIWWCSVFFNCVCVCVNWWRAESQSHCPVLWLIVSEELVQPRDERLRRCFPTLNSHLPCFQDLSIHVQYIFCVSTVLTVISLCVSVVEPPAAMMVGKNTTQVTNIHVPRVQALENCFCARACLCLQLLCEQKHWRVFVSLNIAAICVRMAYYFRQGPPLFIRELS